MAEPDDDYTTEEIAEMQRVLDSNGRKEHLRGWFWKPLWLFFVVSAPFVYFSAFIVKWFDEDLLELIALYFLLSIVVLIAGLISGAFRWWRGVVMIMTIALVFIIRDSPTSLNDLNMLGFDIYRWPDQRYVSTHCNLRPFIQAGKTYYVGVCNWQDSDGILLVYDTSGDIANDAEQKLRTKTMDNYNWAVAITSSIISIPTFKQGTPFDSQDFFTTRAFGPFYRVTFDDEDIAGFIGEFHSRIESAFKLPY